MDQTDTTTSSRTHQRSQPSEDGQKFDVFLSHSGKQKNFVRQLHRDLTNKGFSCFFDQDRESLPVAENFPSRILEAAKTCKVAVLLLSEDFLESKWPMLELSAFVEARDKTGTNPNFKILPLFFQIPPHALKNITADNEKWKEIEKSKERRAEWHRALKVIRGINGLKLTEGGDELEFRDEIVKEIWRILPTPFPRYYVHAMQGERRMCQKLAGFFNEVQPKKEGVRIAGLYGIAGQGKTTLGKAFCNFKMGEFEGKICHLEFSRGDAFEYVKLALKHLTHYSESNLQGLINKDQAQVEFYRRVKGQRVLLVLDNITEESMSEVAYYLKAELGKNSWILLSARSVDVLKNHFQIDRQSCMHVPRLKEEETIAILLERAFAGVPTLGAEDRRFALKCANRCSFKENRFDNDPRARTFHPLALKAFGGYLSRKYGLNLSKWVDSMVDRPGDGFDDVFALLDKAFDEMLPVYRTIFMLLTVYMLPNMSREKVTEWIAINCNEKISFIEKAVEGLVEMAFIEEFKNEIRIHDLYIEFAQRKANEMERWLWRKKDDDQDDRRGLIAKHEAGFELAKLEQCRYRIINPKYLGNLFANQLVGVDVQGMIKLDLGPMDKLRSITLSDCKGLAALDGMEKLLELGWLQIRGGDPMFKLPELSSLIGLQHLEIDIAVSHGLNQLGDLTGCVFLREINVRCPSLLELPRLHGLPYLAKVEFSVCDKVKGSLDCRECVELQSVVIDSCSQMAASPILTGCSKLANIVLMKCDALNTLELLTLSNLTVLVLHECGLTEPPDLTCCVMLEDVYFFKLKNLVTFPKFSFARELKELRLEECTMVRDPPDISGCHKMKVFHLVHNDNMERLPEMGGLSMLQEFRLSWHSENKVINKAIDSDTSKAIGDGEYLLGCCKYEDLQSLTGVSVPDALKELQWLKGKTMVVKRYFREVKLCYCITASSQWKIVIVLSVDIQCARTKRKILKMVALIEGVECIAVDSNEKKITITGSENPKVVFEKLRKIDMNAKLLSAVPV